MENKNENSTKNEELDKNLMDHSYDGIQELDNVLPPWWKYLFYGTIIFALTYSVFFFGMGKFSQKDELAAELAAGKAQVAEFEKEHGAAVNEDNVTLVTDAASIADGKSVFEKNCVPCHGPNGGGGIGPNFTDNYWIHGNQIKDLFRTITHGVPEKGMIPWETTLKPEQRQHVASFILTEFAGKNIAGGKEPQGTPY